MSFGIILSFFSCLSVCLYGQIYFFLFRARNGDRTRINCLEGSYASRYTTRMLGRQVPVLSPLYDVVMYRRISPAIDGTGVEPVWPALSGFLRKPYRTPFGGLLPARPEPQSGVLPLNYSGRAV